MLTIALPITIQQLVSSSGSIIDNLMVSGLGSVAIGAVGAMNKFILIFWFTIHGLTSGGVTFVSQYYARKDYQSIKKILGLTLCLNLAIATIFTYLSLFHSSDIAKFFTSDPETISLAKQYLFAMSAYYIFSAIPYTYSYPLRAVGKAHLAMYIMFGSQVVNIFLNYILITGRLGFPALGVSGAAIATVFSKVVENFLMLFFVYKMKYVVAAKVKEMLSFSYSFMVGYMKVVSPLAINEVFWSIGLMFYQVIIGHLGPEAMASYGMIAPFENLLIGAFSGIANAALVMVGQSLSKEKYDEAYDLGGKFSILATVIALSIGLPTAIFARKIISIYSLMVVNKASISKVDIDNAVILLRVLGIFMCVRVYNLTAFAGILKSGGDTLFLFLIETGSLWIIGLPLAYFVAIIGLPVYIVYFSVYLEEIIKAGLIRYRFRSKKWMKRLIRLD